MGYKLYPLITVTNVFREGSVATFVDLLCKLPSHVVFDLFCDSV